MPNGGFAVRAENLYYATMTYEQGLPVKVIFNKPEPMVDILGIHQRLGLKQFPRRDGKVSARDVLLQRLSRAPFEREDRQILPAPTGTTYDKKPQMSAYEVTEEMLRRIASDQYELMCSISPTATWSTTPASSRRGRASRPSMSAWAGGRRRPRRGGADCDGRPRQLRTDDRPRDRRSAHRPHNMRCRSHRRG